MFESQRDAEMRLTGCMVRYNGTPVFIEGVLNGTNLAVFIPEKKITEAISWDDPNFDFSSAPLGYINHGSKAIFSCRIPHRKYKQGVSVQNITVDSGSARDVFPSDGLYSCVKNEYPSFDEAVATLRKGRSIAFHRWWMVKQALEGIHLYHRGNRVGEVVNGRPVLLKTKRFLKECLEVALK